MKERIFADIIKSIDNLARIQNEVNNGMEKLKREIEKEATENERTANATTRGDSTKESHTSKSE